MPKRSWNLNTVYISERLQECLRPISRCALTTVVAPMGYGKTTAVNWYLLERAKLDEAAVVRISVYSDNLAIFWKSVQEAFSHAGLDFLRAYPCPDDAAGGSLLTDDLCHALAGKRPCYIFIDDFHLLTDNRVPAFLCTLTNRLPENVHLIVASRDRFLPAEEILRLGGRLYTVGAEQLRLNHTELSIYAHRCGTELSDAQIERYANKFIPLVDPNFVCFVVDEQDQLVAFGVTALDPSVALKHSDGRLFPFGWAGVLNDLHHSDTLIMLLTSLFIGTAMGAGVAISKYFGAGDYENVSRAVHTNLAFGIVSGTLLTLIGVFLTPTFLVWMNTDAQVMPQAVEYFRYYFLGVLATVLYNMCTSILNALGDSRRPLHYLIISSLVNIALDLLFIGAFRWGVWSAAVATVLSQGTSCVLCLIHLLKKGEVYTVTPRNIRFHTGMLGEIVRYGLPSGIQNCVIGLANVIVQSQINSFGMLAMAAYGAHCKIEGFAFLPITSFTMACTTFVGQNLGAKQYDRAKRGARFCIIIAVVMAELIGLCYYIWASQLISLFDSTPGVVALGVQQARTVALFYCLLAFSHSIAAVCRGAGRAVVPMMIMLSVWCVIRIIYIMLVVHFIGEIGYIYWAYPLTWAISSTIYLIYYLRSDWVHGFER